MCDGRMLVVLIKIACWTAKEKMIPSRQKEGIHVLHGQAASDDHCMIKISQNLRKVKTASRGMLAFLDGADGRQTNSTSRNCGKILQNHWCFFNHTIQKLILNGKTLYNHEHMYYNLSYEIPGQNYKNGMVVSCLLCFEWETDESGIITI